jgi:uncharacterized repeat protein (TIGR03803 family)
MIESRALPNRRAVWRTGGIEEFHLRPPVNCVAKAMSLAVLLLTTGAACGQFAHFPLKAFCAPDLMGGEPFARIIQGRDGALYGTTTLGGGSVQGTVFKLNKDGSGFNILHNFTAKRGEGATPYAELVEGRDGAFYGTTRNGGNGTNGIIFKLNKDGTGYQVLHNFAATGEGGANPSAALIEGKDGLLYGTAHLGGSSNLGTIFGLNKDGTGFRILHTFASIAKDGVQPTSPVLEASDGALYGTTYFGGATNKGTIFKLNRDGSGYRILFNFTGTNGVGASPYAGLIEGSDSSLYGTTVEGGASQLGTLFKMSRDGSGFRILHTFTGGPGDGAQPFGNVVEGVDGTLYGATAFGGATDQGAVFRINKDGTGYRMISSFAANWDGMNPYAGLSRGTDGSLYGMTQFGGNRDFGTVFELSEAATKHRVLHHFANGGDGAAPYSPLLEASDGSFFGTSWDGGSTNLGAVFRISRDGSGYRVVHSFGAGVDGRSPYGALFQASDGAIYGTTVAGGPARLGTVFRLSQDALGYRVLYNFTNVLDDATQPYGGVIEGTDGALYGTATYGGTANQGAVFKLNKDGTGYRVLYRFAGGTDGRNPYVTMARGTDGALYGTTTYGGTADFGTVFRLNPDGSAYRILHQFTGTAKDNDGNYPFAGLIEGGDGGLYGVTVLGGATNLGTVFRLNKDGSAYRVLHSFTGTNGDGAQPGSGAKLVEGGDGALYGTTFIGGKNGVGTVFRLTKDGAEYEVIYNFTGNDGEGARPFAGLRKGRDGILYGTSMGGGIGCGTMFGISPVASLSIAANGDLILGGPSGFKFTLQYLDDLNPPHQWRELATAILPNKPATAKFPAFGGKQQRFYRAVLFP